MTIRRFDGALNASQVRMTYIVALASTNRQAGGRPDDARRPMALIPRAEGVRLTQRDQAKHPIQKKAKL